MILVRYRTKKEPEIVFEGTQEELDIKIKKLNLHQHEELYYYATGMKKNLGTDKGSNKHDYYFVYESREEKKKFD